MFVLINTFECEMKKVWEVLCKFFPNQEESFIIIYLELEDFIFNTKTNKIVFHNYKSRNKYHNTLNVISTTNGLTYGVKDLPLVRVSTTGEIDYFNVIKFKQYRRKLIIDNLDI